MSWELEYEHVNKAQGIHRFGFIERNVIDEDGQPARYKHDIRLGMGADGESCGHCNQPVKREISLWRDGTLTHVVDGELVPQQVKKKIIAALNEFHGRMDAYVGKHGSPLYKGPGK
jgi:hypothetical protein